MTELHSPAILILILCGLDMSSRSDSLVIVDDDPRVRKMFSSCLEEFGVSAEFCADSFQLLDCIVQSKPKLVLMDFLMPQMDGIECCRRLRNSGFDGYLCVVSSLYDSVVVDSALEAGADKYILKSDIFESLESLLKEVGFDV